MFRKNYSHQYAKVIELNNFTYTCPEDVAYLGLRTGDIVLVKGKCFLSKLVSFYTGNFSHVGFMLHEDDEYKIFDANPYRGTVNSGSLADLDGLDVTIIRFKGSIMDIARIKKAMESFRGVRYERDAWEFVKFVLPLPRFLAYPPSQTQFCSELVINVLEDAGLIEDIEENFVHPGSFITNKKVVKVLTEKQMY